MEPTESFTLNPKTETKQHLIRPGIQGGDGFLTPTGLFIFCGPDEHDSAAKFALEKFLKNRPELSNTLDLTNPRKALADLGFVHLSGGRPLFPNTPLTKKQIHKILEKGLEIPNANLEPTIFEKAINYSKEHPNEKISQLINSFLENGSISFFGELMTMDTILELLTDKLTYGGESHAINGFSHDQYTYYYYKNPSNSSPVVIRYNKHIHDSTQRNNSIIEYSLVSTTYQELVNTTGNDPLKNFHNSTKIHPSEEPTPPQVNSYPTPTLTEEEFNKSLDEANPLRQKRI